MISRCCFWFCLGLSLVSCDKPRKLADRPDPEAAGAQLTRVPRRTAPDRPQSREHLRERLQHAREIGAPGERNQALAAVVWDALETDPELAREGFEQLTAGSAEKNRLIQHYALRMAEQNIDDAVQWASALATDEEKSLAFGGIALVVAEHDPQRAANLLSDSGIAGREFDVAVVQVVQRWAAQAPAAAAAWVALFDAGEARRDGLTAVVGVWAQTDPQGAMTWIAAIQDPTIQQEAVRGLARTLLEQPPSRQDEWLRLAPPGLRSRLEQPGTAE